MLRKKRLFALAVGAVLVGLLTLTPTAASGQGQQKLGGAWTGREEPAGHFWISTLSPLDSAAKEATIRTSFVTYSAEMAGLAAKFGADSFSDFVGEARMIDRTTARWTSVGYGLARSQLNQAPVKKIILLIFGTWTFTDSEHAVLQYRVNIYPAAADGDGDGMPDVISTPFFEDVRDTAQRVPILR